MIKVITNVDINDLGLSVRAWNCLRRAKIDTLQDIVDSIDNLPKVRNLGRKAYDEVLEKIKPYIEVVDETRITHYERIKSMSVEEIALAMTNLKTIVVSEIISQLGIAPRNIQHEPEKDLELYTQWLLQEVSENENNS